MKPIRKTETINLRVSKERKEEIRKAAKAIGMDMSKYLIHQATHGKIVVVSGGKELAMEIYELNQRLNRLEKFPFVNVQELRDTLSDGIARINSAKEGIQDVDTEI